MNLDYPYNQSEPDLSLIGKKVKKQTNKPFKSTLKTATIKGFTLHDITKKLSFTFIEDDSYVECFRCKLIE